MHALHHTRCYQEQGHVRPLSRPHFYGTAPASDLARCTWLLRACRQLPSSYIEEPGIFVVQFFDK